MIEVSQFVACVLTRAFRLWIRLEEILIVSYESSIFWVGSLSLPSLMRRSGAQCPDAAQSETFSLSGDFSMELDLHGHDTRDVIESGIIAKIVQHAWEMGQAELRLIHGHGRRRGKSPGFVNTNTGRLGIAVRRELRLNRKLRQWIKPTTLNCGDFGATSVQLKPNPNPTRTKVDRDLLPERSYKW
jgi:hypothetical protein